MPRTRPDACRWADARRLRHMPDAAPAARSSLRRSSPCRGHPLDQGKSDQTPAGLLARGSKLDTWPSQASHDLASGPVADLPIEERSICVSLAAYSCRDSRGLGCQASTPHSPLSPREGTDAISESGFAPLPMTPITLPGPVAKMAVYPNPAIRAGPFPLEMSRLRGKRMVPLTGLEPVAPSLRMMCSTN